MARRRFGIAAHLYTLRRAGDQGIGDFSTLADIGRRTAAEGGASSGSTRCTRFSPRTGACASPYSPSDRRFLDPIYVDVAAICRSWRDLPEVARRSRCGGLGLRRRCGRRRRSTTLASGPRSAACSAAAAAASATLPPDHPAAAALRASVAEGGPGLQRFATFEAISAAVSARLVAGVAGGAASTRTARPCGTSRPPAPEAVRLAAFMQWMADRQLAAGRARATGGRPVPGLLSRPRGRHRAGSAPRPGRSRTCS